MRHALLLIIALFTLLGCRSKYTSPTYSKPDVQASLRPPVHEPPVHERPVHEPAETPVPSITGLELVVSTPKKVYRVGEPIPLKVIVRNRDDQCWSVWLEGLGKSLWHPLVTIRSERGECMYSCYPWNVMNMMMMMPHSYIVPLVPHATWSYSRPDLGADWVGPMIRRPGKYTVSAWYQVRAKPAWLKEDKYFPLCIGKLASNTLVITIKEWAAP